MVKAPLAYVYDGISLFEFEYAWLALLLLRGVRRGVSFALRFLRFIVLAGWLIYGYTDTFAFSF